MLGSARTAALRSATPARHAAPSSRRALASAPSAAHRPVPRRSPPPPPHPSAPPAEPQLAHRCPNVGSRPSCSATSSGSRRCPSRATRRTCASCCPLLRTAREIVDRYGGTIEKFIGDAVMAVWGVPTAHEDDAERAVRAGLDLVQSVAAFGRIRRGPGAGNARRCGDGRGRCDRRSDCTRAWSRATPSTPLRACSAARTAGRGVGRRRPAILAAASIDFADVGEHAMKGKAAPGPALGGHRPARRARPARGSSRPSAGPTRRAPGRDRRWSRSCSTSPPRSCARACCCSRATRGSARAGSAGSCCNYLDGLFAPRVVARRALPVLRRRRRVLRAY